jgi:hypothetical protein
MFRHFDVLRGLDPAKGRKDIVDIVLVRVDGFRPNKKNEDRVCRMQVYIPEG